MDFIWRKGNNFHQINVILYDMDEILGPISAGIPIEMLCWRNQRKKQYKFEAFGINLYKTQGVDIAR